MEVFVSTLDAPSIPIIAGTSFLLNLSLRLIYRSASPRTLLSCLIRPSSGPMPSQPRRTHQPPTRVTNNCVQATPDCACPLFMPVGFAFSRWCCHRYSHDANTQIG